MFSKELENLIQATLEDGNIESYEKTALQKRAMAEGVDLTELEIYINSIIQKRKKEAEQKENAEYKQLEHKRKEDFGKRCPNCGRQIPSLALICECGYEFKHKKQKSSVEELQKKVEQLIYRSKYDFTGEDDDDKENNRTQAIMDTIGMFPVPNTKEDIIDFLAMSASLSKRKYGLWGTYLGRVAIVVLLAIVVFILFFILIDDDEASEALAFIYSGITILFGLGITLTVDHNPIRYNRLAKAWRSKFEQVLDKGRSLRADPEFTRLLDYYEKQVRK